MNPVPNHVSGAYRRQKLTLRHSASPLGFIAMRPGHFYSLASDQWRQAENQLFPKR